MKYTEHVHTSSVYFLLYFKYQPEDDLYIVETCSWLLIIHVKFSFGSFNLPLFVRKNFGIQVNYESRGAVR